MDVPSGILGGDFAIILAIKATIAGTTKHQVPTLLNRTAAAAAPTANVNTAADMRRIRNWVASRVSGGNPRIASAASIISCVVVPVMSVVGGELPK